MKKNDFGVFEIVIPANNGQPAIEHKSKLKVGRHALLYIEIHCMTDNESCRFQ